MTKIGNTKIEWTHYTGNTHWGCSKIKNHKGCDNCYAEYFSDVRYKNNIWGNDKPRKVVKSIWGKLMKWQALAESKNEIHRVFVGSMMDIFEKPKPLIDWHGKPLEGTTDDLRQKLFNDFIPNCPNLMFLLLTKRPSNINKYIPQSWKTNPPKNVMFGTSVSDQKTANTMIPLLVRVKGKRFLSLEPQLEEVDLEAFWTKDNIPKGRLIEELDWVIVGGESGKNKRPFNADWARLTKYQCKSYDVPFFMKQIDKVQEIPKDLMVREFPSYHNYIINAA